MARRRSSAAAPQPASSPRPAAAPRHPGPIGPWAFAAVALTSTAASSVVMIVLLFAVLRFGGFGPRPTPGPPGPPVDPAFVALGEAYGPELVKTYAESWRTMADRVDSGRPIGEAVTAFATDWTDRRNKLFDAQLAGPFKALVPEGATEDQITSGQRAAYAAAARGVAEGLSQ